MLRVLLARGADPSHATNNGVTPAMAASGEGHLEVVQLLATHGADIQAVSNAGGTARLCAELNNHPTLVTFIDATENWHSFRIAIACRLHVNLRHLLKTGKVDPAGCCPLPTLVDTATSTTMWEGQPPVCPITTRLARMVFSKWSPSTHWLHHGRFREVVSTVLLVAGRLVTTAEIDQPVLPFELWLAVVVQLHRGDYYDDMIT